MNRALYAGMWMAVVLVGCVIEPGPAPPGGVLVSGPPPEPLVEARPPLTRSHSVWVLGYWHWTGLQYTWIPGHWQSGPGGAHWQGPRYLVRDGVYYYLPGGWSP